MLNDNINNNNNITTITITINNNNIKLLNDYLYDAQLYPITLDEHDRNYPPHFKNVDIDIIMNNGNGKCTVIGSDLTKEYVDVNADYRS